MGIIIKIFYLLFIFSAISLAKTDVWNGLSKVNDSDSTNIFENFSMQIKAEILQFSDAQIKENPYKKFINQTLLTPINQHKKCMKETILELFNAPSFYTNNIQLEVSAKSYTYIDTPQFFSAEIALFSYYGGAHGNCERIGYNFLISPKTSAKLLTFSDILKKDKILDFIKFAIQKVDRTSYIIDEIDEPKNTELLNEMSFVFKNECLLVIFQKYSIACGAVGVVESEISYPDFKKFASELSNQIISIISIKK